MLLKEMYEELEKLGGFSTNLENLTEEQIDFLEGNNEYNIDLGDLLNIINKYFELEDTEIMYIYNDKYELGYDEVKRLSSIPDYLEPYFDFEEFGEALLQDDYYYELSDDRIAYICL